MSQTPLLPSEQAAHSSARILNAPALRDSIMSDLCRRQEEVEALDYARIRAPYSTNGIRALSDTPGRHVHMACSGTSHKALPSCKGSWCKARTGDRQAKHMLLQLPMRAMHDGVHSLTTVQLTPGLMMLSSCCCCERKQRRRHDLHTWLAKPDLAILVTAKQNPQHCTYTGSARYPTGACTAQSRDPVPQYRASQATSDLYSLQGL